MHASQGVLKAHHFLVSMQTLDYFPIFLLVGILCTVLTTNNTVIDLVSAFIFDNNIPFLQICYMLKHRLARNKKLGLVSGKTLNGLSAIVSRNFKSCLVQILLDSFSCRTIDLYFCYVR